MKKSSALLVFTALSLSACGDSGGISNPREWLSSQDGPKVEGVSATLQKSAAEAEATGNFRTAAGYYQQMLDKDPENASLRVALADNVRKQGDADKSIPLYDAALAKDPTNGPAREGKALALMQRGDFEAAQQLLTQLQTEGKATWRSYNALGIMAAGRQSLSEATTFFNEANRLSPGNAPVLNNTGLTQALNREYDVALSTLNQAASLAAGRTAQKRQIDLNMALVYAAAGRLDDAESVARNYFEGPALSNNMGFYAHLAKDDALAKTYLNMALTQSKRFYPRAWENLQALNAGRALPNPMAAEAFAPPATAPALTLAPAVAPQTEPGVTTVELNPIEVSPEASIAQPVVLQPPPAAEASPSAGTPEHTQVQPEAKQSGGWFDDLLDF